MTDTKTLHIKFTDAELRRLAEQSVTHNVRDHRYPALHFRFGKDRARGSWHLVRHVDGKSPSRKLGNWPDLSAKTAIELLPKKLAELTADPKALVSVSSWERVEDLLRWYTDRIERTRKLSAKWKGTVRSAVACQLLPRLGSLSLQMVDRQALDDRLIWPMQEVRSLAYTRQAFGLLKKAFKQAAGLDMLSQNPLAEVVFSDFIDTPIRPKPCALRPHQLPELVKRLSAGEVRLTAICMLPLMILCHGTRIGETRLAKWQNLTLEGEGEWFLPAADTKTDNDHRLPLTRHTVALLKAYRTRQKQAGYTGAYLFPRGDGDPITDNQSQEMIASLTAGEWSSHDLRKIARSMWLDLGVEYFIGEMLLNHAMDDLQAAYIHTHAETLKRQALERWHLWLEAQGLSFFATETTPRQAAIATAPNTSSGAA